MDDKKLKTILTGFTAVVTIMKLVIQHRGQERKKNRE